MSSRHRPGSHSSPPYPVSSIYFEVEGPPPASLLAPLQPPHPIQIPQAAVEEAPSEDLDITFEYVIEEDEPEVASNAVVLCDAATQWSRPPSRPASRPGSAAASPRPFLGLRISGVLEALITAAAPVYAPRAPRASPPPPPAYADSATRVTRRPPALIIQRRAHAPWAATDPFTSLSSATTGASNNFITLLYNRQDRTWDRSGRVTAMLPNNSYYVSLDGSRRVTQRTRAHIKPIAIFPIHSGDVFSGRLRPGALSDAPVVTQPRVVPVPVTAVDGARPKTPPLEPAHAQEDVADDIATPVKIERDIDGAATRPSSSSPVLRRRRLHAHPSSVSQPAPRPSVPPRLAPAGDDIAPKRRRGRPRKAPAPQLFSDVVRAADNQSTADPVRQPL